MLSEDADNYTGDLLAAVGRQAIRRYLGGRGKKHADVPSNHSGHGFSKFWFGHRYVPDHAPSVDEHLALWQTFELLTERQRGDLAALAVSLDLRTAAEHRGVHPKTFSRRLVGARRAFARAWFAPDRPPRPTRVVNERVKTGPRAWAKNHKPGQGVSWNKQHQSWTARGFANGKAVYIGSRKTKEAALALVERWWEAQRRGWPPSEVRSRRGKWLAKVLDRGMDVHLGLFDEENQAWDAIEEHWTKRGIGD